MIIQHSSDSENGLHMWVRMNKWINIPLIIIMGQYYTTFQMFRLKTRLFKEINTQLYCTYHREDQINPKWFNKIQDICLFHVVQFDHFNI